MGEWRKSWDGSFEYCHDCSRQKKDGHAGDCVYTENAALKAATERLSAEDARIASHWPAQSVFEDDEICRALQAYADILEGKSED